MTGALPPLAAAEGYVFGLSVCECVRPLGRASVHSGMHPIAVSMITPERIERFSPNLTETFYTGQMNRLSRSRGQCQGRYKVKYLSELLLQAETSTSTHERRSII